LQAFPQAKALVEEPAGAIIVALVGRQITETVQAICHATGIPDLTPEIEGRAKSSLRLLIIILGGQRCT
jgi:hypothetical protein